MQTFAGSALAALPLRSLIAAPPAPPPAGPPLPTPPPGAVSGTLGELLSSDAPATLYVGAKRYPVATVWLEDVHKALPTMPKSEAQQTGAACASFDRAADKWATEAARRGGGGAGAAGGDTAPAGGVADALMLPDVQGAGLLLLAARIAVAIAKPGGGDCILMFVPGMAEIEKMVSMRVCAANARITSSVFICLRAPVTDTDRGVSDCRAGSGGCTAPEARGGQQRRRSCGGNGRGGRRGGRGRPRFAGASVYAGSEMLLLLSMPVCVVAGRERSRAHGRARTRRGGRQRVRGLCG